MSCPVRRVRDRPARPTRPRRLVRPATGSASPCSAVRRWQRRDHGHEPGTTVRRRVRRLLPHRRRTCCPRPAGERSRVDRSGDGCPDRRPGDGSRPCCTADGPPPRCRARHGRGAAGDSPAYRPTQPGDRRRHHLRHHRPRYDGPAHRRSSGARRGLSRSAQDGALPVAPQVAGKLRRPQPRRVVRNARVAARGRGGDGPCR